MSIAPSDPSAYYRPLVPDPGKFYCFGCIRERDPAGPIDLHERIFMENQGKPYYIKYDSEDPFIQATNMLFSETSTHNIKTYVEGELRRCGLHSITAVQVGLKANIVLELTPLYRMVRAACTREQIEHLNCIMQAITIAKQMFPTMNESLLLANPPIDPTRIDAYINGLRERVPSSLDIENESFDETAPLANRHRYLGHLDLGSARSGETTDPR